jgi:hypothetical protein
MDSYHTKKISVADGSSESSSKKNNNALEPRAQSKIQALLMEADCRLRQAENHNAEARDLLGQISHFLDGTDVKEFCRDDGGSTPVTKTGVCV